MNNNFNMEVTMNTNTDLTVNYDVIQSPYTVSKHAGRRMKQRAISEDMVNMCMDFGKIFIQYDGTLAYIITDKIYRKLLKNKGLKHMYKIIDRIKGLVVIISGDGSLITTYKNNKLHRLSHFQKN